MSKSKKCWTLSSADSPPSRPVSEREAGVGATLAVALARRRVTLGFGFALIVLWLASPTRGSVAIGSAVAAVGEAIRIWAAGHVQKAREVTSSGPYRFTAHPLYVGSSVMGVGLAIACANAPAAALIVLYLAATMTAAIATEETFLQRAFGDQYGSYRRGVTTTGTSARIAPAGGRRFSMARAVANR